MLDIRNNLREFGLPARRRRAAARQHKWEDSKGAPWEEDDDTPDDRACMCKTVQNGFLSNFKEKVYKTTIPRNSFIGEAPRKGMPVILHAPESVGAQMYSSLAMEVMRGRG